MLEITSHRNGAVLNSNDGLETGDYLEIELTGIADPQVIVTVNGGKTSRCDRLFSAPARLDKKINKVTVKSHNKFGDFQQTITLVWDKSSFKRYAMRIDDNIFFLTDIAKERPKSLFDHFYLRALKDIHEKYGTKFILKCFYENNHTPFKLKDFPNIYKQEFIDNSNWLRLSFHAYSEFPDRPYQRTAAEKLNADYELVRDELIRFAGAETFMPPTNVHWAMIPPSHIPLMHNWGVRVLTGSFLSSRIIFDGKVAAAEDNACDIGFFYEQDVTKYLVAKNIYYDADQDIYLSRSCCCCNIDSKEEIEAKIRNADTQFGGGKVLEAVTHEQYSFPYYFNYLPDHFERIDTTCRIFTELGYQPVYLGEGLLGNTAWELTK